ncbi:MAG: hypothetical protein KGL39_01445 [Patescibacteria group bacterium]|nr:hypothetical protein [Patescibacteria group bacterium]
MGKAVPIALALVLALIVITTLSSAGPARLRRLGRSTMSGPYNIQLYDVPLYYPDYVGRAATSWDGDKRCAAYCEKEPCAVWCR